MPSLKDVKGKIAGVGKTKQITKAMNMVASAKLRGAQARMERFRAYADSFRDMLRDVAEKEAELTHPLLTGRDEIRRVGVVLVTSDRGLCGSFNSNLIAEALKLAEECRSRGQEIVFYSVGRKGRDALLKRGYSLAGENSGLGGVYPFQVADRLGLQLITDYLSGTIDTVILIYGQFVSLMHQAPRRMQLIPLQSEEQSESRAEPEGSASARIDLLYEPSGEALMQALLPRVLKSFVFKGLLNTATSEQAARMTAMDNATRNCDDLIQTLTQLYNKTRQAAITSELIDIVGGADALQ